MERDSFGDILHSSKRVFLVLHAKYLIIPFLEYSLQIPHISYVQMVAGNIYINVIKKSEHGNFAKILGIFKSY